MGKSTLMHHIAVHKMREKAEGRDGDAIVVIDPHTDLVDGILEHVPDSLTDRVRVIDLSDASRSPGINLLDTRVFADRDRTADSVVRVAKGLWEQWGPRMQSILEQTVKTLHEANEHPETDENEQHTILDGLRLLSNDPYLLEWWARDFGSWHRQYRAEALAPVQTRLSYYASSKRARAILGQRRSTIDIRETILDGGVLLVSTSQGTVGRDVAALVGASLLNLVDAVIREQGSVALRERRGALVVVDEMQTMPGVDYESMLSELGKFGASFILATQSLAKLDDLSRTMRDTLLANVGCLAVFQVAGSDARHLVWELGKDRVTEEDIVSLPVHHCYVRATVGTERMDSFSMEVRKPERGDRDGTGRTASVGPAPPTPSRPSSSPSPRPRATGRWRSSAGESRPRMRPARRKRRRRLPTAPSGGSGPAGARRRGRSVRMKINGSERETLGVIASCPFADRLELAAMSGASRSAVYEAVGGLEDAGLVAHVPHAADLIPPTRRYHLTARGLGALAESEGSSIDDLLRSRPVSVQWLRILMDRLDALAVVYRLASTVAGVAHPVGLRLYRAGPLDAAMTLPGGRTVGIARQGHAADRTGFSRRLWKLRDGPRPGTVLVLVADEVRLRHARKMLPRTVEALFALERDAALAGPEDEVWRPVASGPPAHLRNALGQLAPGGELPVEADPSQADLPGDGAPDADRALPVLLKPAEKRALDLIYDWPWLLRTELASLMAVSERRASQLVNPLEGFGLVIRPIDGSGRLALTDRGVALLARRDRTSVAVARRRWSVAPVDAEAPCPHATGATSPAAGAASCSGTSSTPGPFTPSSPPWRGRPTPWGGSWPRSTRPGARRGTSSTRDGTAPSTPTPSASSEEARPPRPSSWSGRGERCAPRRWRRASPPICATTYLIVPSTTTAPGPPS